MPVDEQKVNTTLREVIGESVGSQTQKKSDDNKSTQTDSGDKREFVSGLDVSDVPDNMSKSEFKEYLAKKGKLLEDGYQSKFKGVAELARVQDELKQLGVSAQEAKKIINDAIANKNNTSLKDVTKEVKREIDALKDEAPDMETRKGVERLEKVIKELSVDSPAYKELKKDIEDIKKGLGFVQKKNIDSRIESITSSLDSLKGEKFDGDFIEKYRDKVVELGKQYPEASVRELIKAASTADDYDDALLKTKKQEQTKENRIKEKLNANDSASSGVTGKEKQLDVRKTGMKDLLSHVFAGKK
jgi:hypothetical protein